MSAPYFAGLRDDYTVIAADPPWLYQKAPGSKTARISATGTADLHYTAMTNEEIRDLPVRDLAAPDAHLFMWLTNPGLYGGRFSEVTPADIATSWGFEFKTLITWVKTARDGNPRGGGMGWYFRGCTEHVLYAVRGKASIPPELREPNVILAGPSGHSRKPPEFFQMVDRVVPKGARLELFARARRPGWDAWGDEADGLLPRPERVGGPDLLDLLNEGAA